MELSPEELYHDRLRRIEDAVQLKVPDRVPILTSLATFQLHYVGMTCEEAYFNPEKWCDATKHTVLAFQPDMYRHNITSGYIHEYLDNRQYKLPGRGAPSNSTHQFVEDEYMKADEYDALLADPVDYAIRTYMPRVYGALKSFAELPPLISCLFGLSIAPLVAKPEIVSAFEALVKTGREMTRVAGLVEDFEREMIALGFPAVGRGGTGAPFDFISDFLRGMQGSMLDMYRQPEKLIEVQAQLLELRIQLSVAAAKQGENPRVFVPLHRGADGFMSPKQFETFYWPGLKKAICALVDAGITPFIFFEGTYDQRLEYLRELPRGKIVAQFDKTDMTRAKDVIGDTMCIMGNMPSSLLSVGTHKQVTAYAKQLIDVVGEGGGYIMAGGYSLTEARPELVKVWIDFTKEYGHYTR
jgi:uroporphyrinogen-III decarboxylase